MCASIFRQSVSSLLVLLLLQPSAAAFDTFWHSAATSAAARAYGFSDNAANILQFGNFSGPDFFGPLYDAAGGEAIEHWQNSPVYAKLNDFMGFRNQNLRVRKMAIFMHFDNLNGKLDANLKFDYLFLRLLYNTQQLLADLNGRSDLSEGHRKIAILSALGSTLLLSCAVYKWDGFNPVPARVAECKGILGLAPAAQALGMAMPGYSGIIPTPYNEFWYVQTKLNLVDKLADGFGSQSGDYFFNFPTLPPHMFAGITY